MHRLRLEQEGSCACEQRRAVELGLDSGADAGHAQHGVCAQEWWVEQHR